MNLYRNKFSVLGQFIRKKSDILNLPKIIKCGQPTAETHPHLIKPGEILPQIQVTEFQERRYKLMELINNFKQSKNKKSNLVVIPSATKKYMSDKIPYVFRQNSDYLYLSGCLEPDSCLVIHTKGQSNEIYSTLFVRNSDSHSELWDGPRTSVDSAPSLFGVDGSLPMSDLNSFLQSYISSNKNCNLWYDSSNTQPFVEKIISELAHNTFNLQKTSPKTFIHQMRLYKSPAEIELMKKSCEIASDAFNRTIGISKPNLTEHQLYAFFDYNCRISGAEYLAYPPVVAGGERATIIHYINNNQVISNGELILMDAGCEYHGYSSDITRTWPINGKFTTEQQILYETIQYIQSNLFQMLYQLPTLDNLFDAMCKDLGKSLQEIGIISKKLSGQELFKAAYEFCPHHVSHYLGMDVHDTSSIPRNIKLEPGMVITVEPGIYINDKHSVPPQYKGLGIRIEDDVLITENGPIILTKKCTKDIKEIEKLICIWKSPSL